MRAFFAIELADATRAAASAAADALRSQLGESADGLRWVRPEAMHVTLRFLGEIDPPQQAALCASVREATAGQGAFELRLGSLTAFPTERRPRVLVLGVEPAGHVLSLAAAVERGVQAAGLKAEDRPFRAHLTLARVQRARIEFPASRQSAEPAGMTVRDIVLFESELGAGGARYSARERIPLDAH